MDRRRTFVTPTKNTFASDYINNKRSKIKFSGTSNLANTVVQQGGRFPLVTPSGYLKPYQGTYTFSSSTQTQGVAIQGKRHTETVCGDVAAVTSASVRGPPYIILNFG
jgi:hypothetical protein